MSRYGRRSGNDLAYGDDHYEGERWDRDRFERERRERMRNNTRGSESFRFEEDEYDRRGGGREKDIRVEIDEDRRGGGRRGGRDPYDRPAYDDERYEAPRRQRPQYLEDDRFEKSGRELAPYRPPEPRYDRYADQRDYYAVPDRRPARPQYVRRQTSLDFDDRGNDRRPRYGDRDDEERDVNVNVNLSGFDAPRAPEPPSRDRYERPPRDDFEEYRDVSYYREKDRDVYRRRRSSSPESEVEERETIVERKEKKRKDPKSSRAKFPKRLAHLKSIIALGYPFEEDEHFFYVYQKGVTKEEIDFVIDTSRPLLHSDERSSTSIHIDERKMLEAPAPPRPETYYEPARQDEGEDEIVETTTTKIIENPTAEEIERYTTNDVEGARVGSVAGPHRSGRSRKSKSRAGTRRSSSSDTTTRQSVVFDKTAAISIRSPSPTRHGHRGRSSSRLRGDQIFDDRRSNNNESLSLVLPERGKSRSRKDIQEEIRRLEDEKREIRRSGGRSKSRRRSRSRSKSEEEYDMVEDNEIRVERNRGGQLQFERDAPNKRNKSRRRRPTQRDVNAALFSMT